MNEALNALYQLQLVDTELMQLEKQYHALDPGRGEQAALEQAQAAHSASITDLHAAQGELLASELELKTVEAKSKEFSKKRDSGKVSNWKELESMQAEIDALGRQRAGLDEKILTLMDALEVQKGNEATVKAGVTSAEEALAARQQEHKLRLRQMSHRAKALTADRIEKVKPIAPDLLKRFDSLKAKIGGIAIARLVGSDCSVCHTNLPSNLVTAVRDTNSILTCENCGRILCVGD